ncbi:MAG: DUF3352 domain-containing protein [Candidatus Limnocylindria bacterium]
MHRLVIALTALLGLTAGAYLAGYLLLFSGSGDTAAELAPADTVVFVSISLQPSSGQDGAIRQLASRLPGFADTSAFDQKIDELAQNLISQLGLDYRQHVKPWLGPQLAVVMRDLTATPTLLIAVRDQAAAVESLNALEGDRGGAFDAASHGRIEVRSSEGVAYAFVGETLVVSPDAAAVEAVIDVSTGGESLADRAEFGTAMERIEADRLASLFVDVAAVLGDDSRYRTAAGALVAEPEGLVLRGRADAAAADETATAAAAPDVAATLPEWMPVDTQVAMSAFDGGELLLSAEELLADVPAAEGLVGTIESARILFAFGLGLDLNDLILELMRGEGGLALQGLDTDAPTGQLLLRPSDPQAAIALLEDVADRLEGTGANVERDERDGVEVVSIGLAGLGALAYAVTDEVIILGLGAEGVEAAVAAHETGDNLASTDDYAAAWALAGTRTGNEVMMDPAVLLSILGLGGELPSDARDILAQLGAVAITLPDRGDHLEFHAVLTVH